GRKCRLEAGGTPMAEIQQFVLPRNLDRRGAPSGPKQRGGHFCHRSVGTARLGSGQTDGGGDGGRRQSRSRRTSVGNDLCTGQSRRRYLTGRVASRAVASDGYQSQYARFDSSGRLSSADDDGMERAGRLVFVVVLRPPAQRREARRKERSRD